MELDFLSVSKYSKQQFSEGMHAREHGGKRPGKSLFAVMNLVIRELRKDLKNLIVEKGGGGVMTIGSWKRREVDLGYSSWKLRKHRQGKTELHLTLDERIYFGHGRRDFIPIRYTEEDIQAITKAVHESLVSCFPGPFLRL